MGTGVDKLGILRELESRDVVHVMVVLAAAWLLASAVRWLLRHAAERAHMRLRLPVLRLIPILRLCIGLAAFALIVPILVEPSFQNVVAIVASVSLAVAFVFKDYASSLVAGLVTVIESPYQPGDWIEVDGTYGEVKLIGLRAVHVVTAYDNEVIIPHSKLWSSKLSNASSGSHSVLCVADFYLDPEHDAAKACECLAAAGAACAHLRPDSEVVVVAREKPWGTHYRIKAYVDESRGQFAFVTDLTVRGKQALRASGFRFARAPYAETGRD